MTLLRFLLSRNPLLLHPLTSRYLPRYLLDLSPDTTCYWLALLLGSCFLFSRQVCSWNLFSAMDQSFGRFVMYACIDLFSHWMYIYMCTCNMYPVVTCFWSCVEDKNKPS